MSKVVYGEMVTLDEWCKVMEKHHDVMLRMEDSVAGDVVDAVEKFKEFKAKNTDEAGDVLEYIVYKLFSQKIFNVRLNERNGFNEIDLLIEMSISGCHVLEDVPIYKDFPKKFIIEVKNYKSKVNVTYVGKMKSLLDTTGTKFGIFISRYGLTGRDKNVWKDATGLARAIATSEDDVSQKCVILDFKIEELSLMLSKERNIIKILNRCREDFITGVNSQFEYITTHPLEEKFSRALNDL